MRSTFPEVVERGRERDGRYETATGDDCGRARLFCSMTRTWLLVFWSGGDEQVPWQHVSVSTRTRCPTWEEMHWIKTLFWSDDEAVMQLHPPKRDYVSQHPYCLHLWRPNIVAIPLPPSIAVGEVDGPALVPA